MSSDRWDESTHCPRCGKRLATDEDFDRYDEGEGGHLCWGRWGNCAVSHADDTLLVMLRSGWRDALVERDEAVARADRAEARLDLAEAALTVIAVGGNGEGWTMQDAVNLLRFATGQAGVCDEWTQAVPPDERHAVERIVGADHAALAGSEEPT